MYLCRICILCAMCACTQKLYATSMVLFVLILHSHATTVNLPTAYTTGTDIYLAFEKESKIASPKEPSRDLSTEKGPSTGVINLRDTRDKDEIKSPVPGERKGRCTLALSVSLSSLAMTRCWSHTHTPHTHTNTGVCPGFFLQRGVDFSLLPSWVVTTVPRDLSTHQLLW